MRLAPYLGPKERHLTVVQGVHYVPQGLDVWAQLECGFPGHYAREQERCPEEGLGHELHCHFEDQEPLVEGSVDERFDRMFTAPLVLNPLMARMAEAAGYEELRDGFGGRARKRADWGPAEKAMLDVIDLENILAIERTTVEKTRNK